MGIGSWQFTFHSSWFYDMFHTENDDAYRLETTMQVRSEGYHLKLMQMRLFL
jgi:hypothetical protein